MNEEYYDNTRAKAVVYIYQRYHKWMPVRSGRIFRNLRRISEATQKLWELARTQKDTQNYRKKQGLKQIDIRPGKDILEQFWLRLQEAKFRQKVTKTERSTFVFDKDMNLVKEFRK
ncbi:MAG: peroxiredoxin [Anaerobutyricum sp.]